MIQLPARPNLSFFYWLFAEMEHFGEEVIDLDWSQVMEIPTGCHCAILHLRDLIDKKGISLTHHHCDGNDAFALFKTVFELKISEKPLYNSGIYISPVNAEKNMPAALEALKGFFGERHKKLEWDFSEISTFFSELYMNICQHSGAEKGYVHISEPDIDGNVLMCFSDLGCGIIHNMRSFLKDRAALSDEVLLNEATKEFVTTKSIQQNQGRGLFSVVNGIQKLKGTLNIVSAYGGLEIAENKIGSIRLEYFHTGTFVMLSFNTQALDHFEQDDYNIDIEF